MFNGTLILTRRDVAGLLDLGDCIAAVERAFRLHGEGRAAPPIAAGLPVPGGGFHVKAALLPGAHLGERPYFVAKVNANFPGNRARLGLPTIQGTIMVADGEDGRPLALMDSIEITTSRTAAATAVAARHLASPEALVVVIIGCGNQGRAQLRALARVRRIRRAIVHDVDPSAAEGLAADLGQELGIPIAIATDPREAAWEGEIVVTCTPSRVFLLGAGDVRPGAFVAGVGADSEEKRELAPDLLAQGTVVVDLLQQCAAFGDLHHALAAGAVTEADVHAELGEVVAGRKPGRTREDEITIFDSTGMALEDAAAAALVYERAVRSGAGLMADLAAVP